MLVARAWPDRPPAAAPHIIDSWPRIQVDDYDYRDLAALADDVIVLDWDIAVSKPDIETFARQVRRAPNVPLAAPYLLHGEAEPVWAHRVYEGTPPVRLRYVATGEPYCDLFGFGMTYLPWTLIAAYIADRPGKIMDDTSFSGWWAGQGHRTSICWAVRPVHLHYPTPPGGNLDG
jgi:hypothetical protein